MTEHNTEPLEFVNKQNDFNKTMTKAIVKLDKATNLQNEINKANIELLQEQDARINTQRQLIIVNLLIAVSAIITALVI